MDTSNIIRRNSFWIVAAIVIALVVLLRLHTIHEPFDRDIAGHSYVAHQILEGKTLYLDVWDHKPPLTPYTFALFQLIFGYNDTAIYMLNIFFSSLIIILVGLISREFMGTMPSLFAMAIYGLVSQDPFLQSNQPNSELLINASKLLAIYLLFISMRSSGKREISLLALSGLAIGLCSIIKMVSVSTFMAMLAIILLKGGNELPGWRSRFKRAIIFSAGAGYVWGITFLGIALQGSMNAFWDAVFVYNNDYAASIWQNVVRYFWEPELAFAPFLVWELPLLILTVVLFGTMVSAEKRFEKFALMLFLFAAAIEVAAPGTFTPHYYQLFVPLIVIAATWAVFEVANGFERVSKNTILFSAITLILLHLVACNLWFLSMPAERIDLKGYTADIHRESKEVGTFMMKNFRPNLSLYEWGAEAGLYYFSKLDSDIPFFYFYPVIFGNAKSRLKRMERLEEALNKNPPDVFIYFSGNRIHQYVPRQLNESVKSYLDSEYTLYRKMGSFTIYCNNALAYGNAGNRRCDIEKKRESEGQGL